MFETHNTSIIIQYAVMIAIAAFLGFMVRYSTENKKLSEMKQKLSRIKYELLKYSA